MSNRIAVHVLDNFCLPVQRGNPGTKERELSNLEMRKTVEEHGLNWEDILCAGYFIPNSWENVDDDTIRFKNSNGEWENVKKSWVIFESECPDFLELLDRQVEENDDWDEGEFPETMGISL